MEEYKTAITIELKRKKSKITEIIDETSFKQNYRLITDTVNKCSRDIFGTRTLLQHSPKLKSKAIAIKAREIHHIRSIIRAINQERVISLHDRRMQWVKEVLGQIMKIACEEEINVIEAARRLRKKKWKELYRAEKEEAERRFDWKIRRSTEEVFKGESSTKRVAGTRVERITPSIITKIKADGSEDTICDENGVKHTYNEHFQNIFKRDKVPAEHGIPKPWLSNKTAQYFNNEAVQFPMK